MKRDWFLAVTVVTVVVVLAAGVWWMQARSPGGPVPDAAPVVVQAPAPRAAEAASEPAIRYPIDAAASEPAGSTLDVESALKDLFGSRAVTSMFQLDDFAHRFVATVDNLGRAHASPRLWPVNPARGRFAVAGTDGATTIDMANAGRYAEFVALIERVDLHRAVAAYARLYPLFQRAYEDLGYPKRYFNDRLVDVIDRLLAAPEPPAPPRVHRAPVKGPVQPERSWVLYEFDDPALESLSAGQKILVRMGVANERRVKAKLAELRGLLAPAAR